MPAGEPEYWNKMMQRAMQEEDSKTWEQEYLGTWTNGGMTFKERWSDNNIKKFFRADGDCLCAGCGRTYERHERNVDWPTFRCLCNNQIVKL
jgi:hypothetical protein